MVASLADIRRVGKGRRLSPDFPVMGALREDYVSIAVAAPTRLQSCPTFQPALSLSNYTNVP